MKKFIGKTITFSILPLISFLGICFLANGYTDPFYIRFTTPKQSNLIIGTSRAAQGIQPKVFKTILGKDISNYAFTVTQSPFGSIYFESIKKKHNKTKGGIFIISVDPWSISSMCYNPNDAESFRENNLCLDNTEFVDMKPNFQYLYKNLKGHYKDIIVPPSKSMYLHRDGWLEVKNIAMDSLSVLKRTNEKVKTYRYIDLPKAKFSSLRLEFLLKTITYLKNYGQVYLVRLPVHNDIMQIENELMPNFDHFINGAIDSSDGYLDLTEYNNKFQFTDGNHLYKTSGKEVSVLIANWIKGQK